MRSTILFSLFAIALTRVAAVPLNITSTSNTSALPTQTSQVIIPTSLPPPFGNIQDVKGPKPTQSS